MPTDLTRYAPQFVARKALFSFLGAEFRIFSPEGQLRFFVKQKAFKLKEEITVFADEGQTQAMLRINARSILDISATYDVVDAATGENVGACKRDGLKSMLRDSWKILGQDGTEIAMVQEDSGLLAIIRRLILPIIPQTFHIQVNGQNVGQIKQRFAFFSLIYDVDMANIPFDRRLGVAITVLLLAIEGRQNKS